ncbi:MAG: hypothetical protein QM638_05855 [Nocardioides sp.]|uniref:hypothetical protein n=1 Tax=Nocardioides sp. TaxID=35761 RepID=UPI0039E21C66
MAHTLLEEPVHTPRWTEEHSRTIAAAAPPVPDVSQQELDLIWCGVRDRMPTAKARRRRRARLVVGGVIAAVTMTLGGVAAAGVISAHTGRYPSDAEDLRLGGPGEYLDPAAPDFGDVVDQETTDIPFPSDKARRISRQDLVQDGQREPIGTSTESTGAMRFWTAQAAVCAWANEWVAAGAAGDTSAKETAAKMLEEAPSWSAVTAIDAKQTMRTVRVKVTYRAGGRITKSSILGQDGTPDKVLRRVGGKRVTRMETERIGSVAGYFPLLRKAALSDDAAEMGSVLADEGTCDPDLMPDFPQAVPSDLPSNPLKH